MARSMGAGWLIAAAWLALAGGPPCPARAEVTLTVSCFSSQGFADACSSAAEEWQQRTGNKVIFFYHPEDTTALLELNRRLLDLHSSEIDIFEVDVVWPGLLAEHFVDLAPYFSPAERQAHFPAIIDNNTVHGRLVAIPWYTDVGLLFYRKDLLAKYGQPVPQTWADLTSSAKLILEGERAAGHLDLQGFLFQGRAYEGLTCNALEWIDSFGGGTLIDGDGRITIGNPGAVAALTTAASWMGTIVPWITLYHTERESRDQFKAGNAIFMRNWPFAWRDVNTADSPVAGQVGVAPLPAGGTAGKHSGTLGGWQLAVSRYSRHPEAAIDLVRHLTSRVEQKRRAIRWSYSPTIAELYQDPEIMAAVPFFQFLYPALANAVARPTRTTGARYGEVSRAFWNAVHDILSGNGDAQSNLDRLNQTLDHLSAGGKWR